MTSLATFLAAQIKRHVSRAPSAEVTRLAALLDDDTQDWRRVGISTLQHVPSGDYVVAEWCDGTPMAIVVGNDDLTRAEKALIADAVQGRIWRDSKRKMPQSATQIAPQADPAASATPTHPGDEIGSSEFQRGWRLGVAAAWRAIEKLPGPNAAMCRNQISALGNKGPMG